MRPRPLPDTTTTASARSWRQAWAALAVVTGTLAGCGGGGGDSAPAAAPPVVPVAPVTPTSTSVPVTVIDGPIRNALVCVDANLNGACDTGETNGRTDASGKVTLAVPNADVGKYPIVAVVGTDAVDADSGAVPVAYAMSSTADQPGLVSPLTTFVQQAVSALGLSTADAAALVQRQAGLAASPMADYIAASDSKAALSAHLLVAAIQKQLAALGDGGAGLSPADVQTVVMADLASGLSAVVGPACDPTLQAQCADKSSAGCKAATDAVTVALLANSDLTRGTVVAAVAANKLVPEAPVAATPVASFNLDWVSYTDASNWYFRVTTATAAENTPDANGLVRYRAIRHEKAAGVETIWGANSNSARKGDLHWDGAAWSGCEATQQNTSTVRDAQGRANYNYCLNYAVGTTQRVTSDITGRTMTEIFGLIQAGRTNGALWGKPGDVSGTTFPAGAKLVVQNDATTATAPAYDVRPSNEVTVADDDVFIGGDARVNPGVGCNQAQGNNATPAGTLERVISHNTGTPCVFAPGTITGAGGVLYPSGATNTGWGNTTTSLGNLGTAPLGTSATATSYYTGNTRLRASFAGGGSNAVTYYACQERVINGSTRNCTVIGTGSYTITTLGDGRAMGFTGLPSAFGPLSFERVFVERGGKVFFGFKDKLTTTKVMRLNDVAGNAVFTRLGLPTFQP